MGTNRNTLRLYWRQIKKHPVTLIVSFISIPLGILFLDTLLAYNLSLAIGALAESNNDVVMGHLTDAALFGGIGILLNFIGFQALIRHESGVRMKLYDETFKSLLRKDFGFYVNEKIGALTSRFIDFSRAHTTIQDLIIIRTLGFTLSLGTSLFIVASHTPILALVLGGLIVLILVQIRISSKLRQPLRKERKKLVAEIHGKVADGLTNNLIVRTFAGERQEQRVLQNDLVGHHKAYVKDIGLMGLDGTFRNIVMTIVQIVAIGLSAYFVMQGSLDLAIAIFILTYVQRIATQIFALGEIMQGFEQAFMDASPMTDILMKEDTVTDKKTAKQLNNITPAISFHNTEYHYPDNPKVVLDAINLDIPAGQKVGLVGHSGAGKTTITHLLLRFADVTGGSITIDGHDLREVTQKSLREHIAYVPQEPLLFHRSLRENIAYGKPDATDEEIKNAAKQANALEFIEKLSDGFDTMVGERGVKLSGGQRQRIAIARALLKNAPILVLDEATSALDSESEALIQDALQKLMKGRTSIVIAHRLSTISKLDRIIVLDNGAITEDGSHEELLQSKGLYSKLWARQSGGFIEE